MVVMLRLLGDMFECAYDNATDNATFHRIISGGAIRDNIIARLRMTPLMRDRLLSCSSISLTVDKYARITKCNANPMIAKSRSEMNSATLISVYLSCLQPITHEWRHLVPYALGGLDTLPQLPMSAIAAI